MHTTNDYSSPPRGLSFELHKGKVWPNGRYLFMQIRLFQTEHVQRCENLRTSGAFQSMFICVVWLDPVIYVTRPVECVVCVHRDVPKFTICDENTERSHRTNSISRRIEADTRKRDANGTSSEACSVVLNFVPVSTLPKANPSGNVFEESVPASRMPVDRMDVPVKNKSKCSAACDTQDR